MSGRAVTGLRIVKLCSYLSHVDCQARCTPLPIEPPLPMQTALALNTTASVASLHKDAGRGGAGGGGSGTGEGGGAGTSHVSNTSET